MNTIKNIKSVLQAFLFGRGKRGGLLFVIHHATFVGTLFLLFSGCYKEQDLPVTVDFSYEVENNNYSVPVRALISNNTTGAEEYKWIFGGAEPSSSTSKDPGVIVYTAPGAYKIKLSATNSYGGSDEKEIEIIIDAKIRIGFTVSNAASNYPNVSLNINNTTQNATTYKWTFEGGTPDVSSQQQPGTIVFSQPGQHKITLEASGGRETLKKDTTIIVLPDIAADFDIAWNPEDNDMEAPFTALLINKSVSATAYSWNVAGAVPNSSTEENPTLKFNAAGNYTIQLTAYNDKKTVTKTKTITLLPNTNLYRFSDVQLGINTAQNTIGCYFSSKLGRPLLANEVNSANGALIDFVYFGLNQNFTYNRIVSPDSAQLYSFLPITNAINAKVINRLETCACGISMNEAAFDAMQNDVALRAINITQTQTGFVQFDNSFLPRIVLFQTADGRRGAIKIKQFVPNGQQSYVVCDIKVMKE
jgi:PKD repeat protein